MLQFRILLQFLYSKMTAISPSLSRRKSSVKDLIGRFQDSSEAKDFKPELITQDAVLEKERERRRSSLQREAAPMKIDRRHDDTSLKVKADPAAAEGKVKEATSQLQAPKLVIPRPRTSPAGRRQASSSSPSSSLRPVPTEVARTETAAGEEERTTCEEAGNGEAPAAAAGTAISATATAPDNVAGAHMETDPSAATEDGDVERTTVTSELELGPVGARPNNSAGKAAIAAADPVEGGAEREQAKDAEGDGKAEEELDHPLPQQKQQQLQASRIEPPSPGLDVRVTHSFSDGRAMYSI